ncbi:low molecular weight protein-tyrosine-phosphatase [Planctobacterium marinum]|uniref:low molecular weight protein-tyrosine-phosphatase n=1 Tax=Planctobacterium marinum TaxID=1631968 RepID=UPI001E5C3DCD|nr:low molecular weight protein-tyrosine-phosphatase [Planctobacterium marinum]MCC2603750.1 low molecular weight phosphotyrosine protein phosphatase [Planctobacterium marinum]
MKKVLFVCLGNICRSPTAEAVFKKMAKEAGLKVEIDSAGTIATHTGEAPDSRSMEHGKKRGYSFHGQFSRKVKQSDFQYFDHIFAMDKSNLRDLLAQCPQEFQHKVQLFLTLSGDPEQEVPDPYYGGDAGFERVLELVENASTALITQLKSA